MPELHGPIPKRISQENAGEAKGYGHCRSIDARGRQPVVRNGGGAGQPRSVVIIARAASTVSASWVMPSAGQVLMKFPSFA